VTDSIRRAHATPSHVTPLAAHALATAAHPAARAAAFHADPRSFAQHRHLAGDPAFRPFWNHGWHPHRHLGWIGPLFWPYAAGDIFYSALWPDDYYDVDPFWAYGYGDIYSAVFSPYSYDDYVSGPSAPAKMATLTQSMAQSCSDEAAEVTGWPIDQIQAAVQPTQQQVALLDDLGNALVKASDEVKSHCPTEVSFTPTARLGEMQRRLQALVDAVAIVNPPLQGFYESLSDEQKARFNSIAPPAPKQTSHNQQAALNPQAECNAGASAMAWPTDLIDRVVKPDDAQRAKLVALQSAASQASDMIKAACPSDLPATPPERLAAVGKRLSTMLQAVSTMQPALADFYNSLSDDQKAHFNGMGKQLFAQNG
jgi:LTXXQ motif family protein